MLVFKYVAVYKIFLMEKNCDKTEHFELWLIYTVCFIVLALCCVELTE